MYQQNENQLNSNSNSNLNSKSKSKSNSSSSKISKSSSTPIHPNLHQTQSSIDSNRKLNLIQSKEEEIVPILNSNSFNKSDSLINSTNQNQISNVKSSNERIFPIRSLNVKKDHSHLHHQSNQSNQSQQTSSQQQQHHQQQQQSYQKSQKHSLAQQQPTKYHQHPIRSNSFNQSPHHQSSNTFNLPISKRSGSSRHSGSSKQSGSSNSNTSSSSSNNFNRPNEFMPSIAEGGPSVLSSSSSYKSSDKSDYSEKFGIGRPRKSSSTRFPLESNHQTSPSKFITNQSKSKSSSQAPASVLINLAGLTDLDTNQLIDHQNLNNSNNYPLSPSSQKTSNSSISLNLDDHQLKSSNHSLSNSSNHHQSNNPNSHSKNIHQLSQNPSYFNQPHSIQSDSTTRHIIPSLSSKSNQLYQTSNLSFHPSTAPLPEIPTDQFNSSPNLNKLPTIENPVSYAGRSFASDSYDQYSQSSSPISPHSNSNPFFTTRFEYIEREGGLMILTGRKDPLTACEDEPIRLPGAIQAFGVLIAVLVHGETIHMPSKPHQSCDPDDPANSLFSIPEDDLLPSEATLIKSKQTQTGGIHEKIQQDEDEGDEEIINITRLQIVQVSENSGHVLGLSPKLLLNLYSFTEVLTESEAQGLCENIEVCLDNKGNNQAGPHTFRLSGTGELGTGINGRNSYMEWSCWCAAHRPDPISRPRLVVIEFELENDEINPPSTISHEPVREDERGGMAGKPYEPTEQDVLESTMSINKPLRALSRLRRKGRDFSGDSVEVLSILGQINEQFDKTDDMSTFLKMVVGVVRELTGFHRVMVYKFDESWNGQVVAELVDWKKTRDLYRGLRFPATDIPAQARELYKINKVRMLFDRDQPTARLVCKSKEELSMPLDMTHCHLRAMSPIHIKYLANMGVRASFSISILTNDQLWGLISCHTYGRYGQRVTFPTRHFCRMLGDTVSRNIYRINLSQRLQSRKLINTSSTSKNPSGYIVAKAEDLLWLFDAAFGVLSIGEEAKLLGTVSNSQEILVILEYLRIKCFDHIQASTDIKETFPDINYPVGFESICGMLVIPLSRGGQDFICFFRPGQLKEIHWAGNPHEKILRDEDNQRSLEPRKSFKIWSETVKGRSKAWTDEQLETGSVLSLVYGKFIDVWRQKEAAVHNNQLQALLLSNASHEVRTPLHQILSTLELALDGPLDDDTRDNLSKSYSASRALVHVINDLLDLTKAEQGGDLFLRDPFHLASTIDEAVSIHRREAERKGLSFEMIEDPLGTPLILKGDRARLRQVISNLVGNAVKHTTTGLVHVQWGQDYSINVDRPLGFEETTRVSISVTDTGKGIAGDKLEGIFRAFEQIGTGESTEDSMSNTLGLGLAVVGRVVHNMGGQLRVDSTVDKGSKFTLILPFAIPQRSSHGSTPIYSDESNSLRLNGSDDASQSALCKRRGGRFSSRRGSHGSFGTTSSGIDDLVDAINSTSDTSSSSRWITPSSQNRVRNLGPVSPSPIEDQFSGSSTHSRISGRIENQSIGPGVHQLIALGKTNAIEKRLSSSDLIRLGSAPPISNPSSTGTHKDLHRDSAPHSAECVEWSKELSQLQKKVKPSEATFSFSQELPSTFEKLRTSSSSRPPIQPIQPTKPPEENETSLRTIVPSSPSKNKTKMAPSPNFVEHISEFQRSNRVRTISKEPMKVMVVEDDPINRVILKKKLTQSGHSVSLTVHGQEAVELFERAHMKFDIILMDLQMPICDGIEATRRIREYEKKVIYGFDPRQTDHRGQRNPEIENLPKSHQVNCGVPIIAVSASLHEKQRGEIQEAGMDGWILKPVDFNRLATLMVSSVDLNLRAEQVYKPGTWDKGGWLQLPNNI
ncbi:hypothetical protein O181_029938 [Austropuccinia psidii MF-1]|uniref:Uncharacterized protein n=1 Tax=Austropuccinia psidii MF-1 TaxID=1389203 RepID=A0A9Q3H374_9BASI|nr:hypothetical protein [Austropuccinia psidii MF-1]